tara:strand:- start:1040 stop:1432 length:393 start_codon:yes stop_codon:yes gene_type:complete
MKTLDIENLQTRLKMGDQSLNKTISEDNASVELISLLKDDSPTQDDIFQNLNDTQLKQKWIFQSINALNEREQFIINSRQLNEKPKTLDEIGKQLKISKERVRQIESSSLKKLRKNILEISNEPKDFFVN